MVRYKEMDSVNSQHVRYLDSYLLEFLHILLPYLIRMQGHEPNSPTAIFEVIDQLHRKRIHR